MLYAKVTSLSFCFILLLVPLNIDGSVSKSKFLPKTLSLSWIIDTLSVSLITISLWVIISPSSIPGAIYIMVIPVLSYPLIIALCNGLPPLNLGNSDAWTLIAWYLGVSSKILGIICPYAHVIIISGLHASTLS